MATPASAPARTYSAWWIIRLVLLILAIICFAAAAFGTPAAGPVQLVPAGLGLGFASMLPL
jgi:hypothetical protein